MLSIPAAFASVLTTSSASTMVVPSSVRVKTRPFSVRSKFEVTFTESFVYAAKAKAAKGNGSLAGEIESVYAVIFEDGTVVVSGREYGGLGSAM